MSAQAQVVPNDFDKATFKTLAQAALRLFDPGSKSKHYYAVGTLRRKMMCLSRENVEAELPYWQNTLKHIVGKQATTYNSFEALHAIDRLRQPLTEVARNGALAGMQKLQEAKAACEAMAQE